MNEDTLTGALLLNPAVLDRVSGIVNPSDFESEPCRNVWLAAEALAVSGVVPDIAAIVDKVKTMGNDYPKSFYMQCMDLSPTTANVEHIAHRVADDSRRRRLKELAISVVDADNSTSTSALIETVSEGLQRLECDAVGNGVLSSADCMHRVFDGMERRLSGEKNYVSSGYPSLDKLLGGGFLNSGLYIIAARPGMGKSTFALNIADKLKCKTLFVSLEMSADQISYKRLARETGIPSGKLMLGTSFTDAESEKIAFGASKIAQSKVQINFKSGMTVDNLGTMCRSIKGLGCLIVDYLGLLNVNGSTSSYERVTAITAGLKRLANSLGIPVIALSQLSRNTENRTDKRPLLSDLRDSGSVEQDADGVILLFRPGYYDKQKRKPWEAELLQAELAKNRHGDTGVVNLAAFLALNRIEDGDNNA